VRNPSVGNNFSFAVGVGARRGIYVLAKRGPSSCMASSGLGAAAASILDAKLPADAVPILARRSAPERAIAEAKREERESHALARAKKTLVNQAHQPLRPKGSAGKSLDVAGVSGNQAANDPVLERTLKKIATNGVVALFNAVRATQTQPAEESKKVGTAHLPPSIPRQMIDLRDPALGAAPSHSIIPFHHCAEAAEAWN
jgi:hypothetical protein